MDFRERSLEVKRILNHARLIATRKGMRSQVPDMIQRWEFLRDRAYVTAPVMIAEDAEPVTVLVGGPAYRWRGFLYALGLIRKNYSDEELERHKLQILPLHTEDANLGRYWKEWTLHKSLCSFNPTENEIVINRTVGETDRFFGFCLLHEAGHAMRAFEEGRVHTGPFSRLPAARAAEELEMWETDSQILKGLGGSTYCRLFEVGVRTAVEALSQGRRVCPQTIGEPFTFVLNDMFGAVSDPVACQQRLKMMSVYCQLEAAEYLLPMPQAYQSKLYFAATNLRSQC